MHINPKDEIKDHIASNNHLPFPYKRQCACGCTLFTAFEQIRSKTLIDAHGHTFAVLDTIEQESYEPYTCINCGKEYSSLSDLVPVSTLEVKNHG